jgi:hypothetical protein
MIISSDRANISSDRAIRYKRDILYSHSIPSTQQPKCHPASTYAATSKYQTTITIPPQDPKPASKPYQKIDIFLAVPLTAILHENDLEKDLE